MNYSERLQLLQKLPVRKIALFRPLKLGDFMAMTPALRAVRAAFPEAAVDYIGLPLMHDLAKRYSNHISDFVPFPGWPGLPEEPWQPETSLEFITNIRSRRYDLLLQMHGNGLVTNPLAALCGARITAGFAAPNAYWPNREWFINYPGTQHEAIRLLKLCEHMGIPMQGTSMEFPIYEADEQALKKVIPNLPEAYVCMHVGAFSSRPWAAQSFATVADQCVERGLAVVFTGTRAEQALIKNVLYNMHSPAIDLSGKTSIGALGALIKRALLYVGNDTGVAHVSVALGTPSLIIFTTADLHRWAPLDTVHNIALSAVNATPERVFESIKKLLTNIAA